MFFFQELASRGWSKWCWTEVVGSSINIHHAFLLCPGDDFLGGLTLGLTIISRWDDWNCMGICFFLCSDIWKDHIQNVILTRCLWINAWYHVVEISSKSMLKYLVICKKFHPRRIPATYHVRRRHRFRFQSSSLSDIDHTQWFPVFVLQPSQTDWQFNPCAWAIDIVIFVPPCFFTVTSFSHVRCDVPGLFVLGFVDMGSLLHNSAWIGIALTLFCTLPWS